jgi:hypothetical protein
MRKVCFVFEFYSTKAELFELGIFFHTQFIYLIDFIDTKVVNIVVLVFPISNFFNNKISQANELSLLAQIWLQKEIDLVLMIMNRILMGKVDGIM